MRGRVFCKVDGNVIYYIEDGKLWADGTELGLSTAIYMDNRQRNPRKDKRFVNKRLPVGDYVFTTPQNHIVIVEEKRLNDLYTSYNNRRLQRELRHMLSENEEGVNVLGLRATTMDEELREIYHKPPTIDVATELIKWQILGGIVGLLPINIVDVYDRLCEWRAVLQPGRSLFSIIAGSDSKADTKPMTRCARALRQILKGVGYQTGQRIADYFRNDLVLALSASDEAWKKAGANKTILQARKELLEVK